MNFECQATCGHNDEDLVLMDIHTEGTQSRHSFVLTLEEAKELQKELNAAISEHEDEGFKP